MTADALATAISVLGAEEGTKLIDSLEGVECMIVTRGDTGETFVSYSRGFEALLSGTD